MGDNVAAVKSVVQMDAHYFNELPTMICLANKTKKPVAYYKVDTGSSACITILVGAVHMKTKEAPKNVHTFPHPQFQC